MEDMAFWDWIYNHHAWLLAALAAIAVVGIAVVAAGLRRRSAVPVAVSAAIVVILAVPIAVFWALADHHSNQRDIEGRVEAVARALPSGAHETARTGGDNYRTRTYVVPESPATTVASVESAFSVMPDAKVYPSRKATDHVTVSFDGGYGCDGVVEVGIAARPAGSATRVEVNGYCED